jgi:phosphoadenosine phosphosulfate reductase
MSLDLESLNERFEASSPREILEWAITDFWPDVIMTSSFQTQSLPLLHMVTQLKPELPIYFLDTGYHFTETLAFKEKLQHAWGLNVVEVCRDAGDEKELAGTGTPLYRTDPDKCCFLCKVAPMEKALQGKRAWITGIRREQTPERPRANIVELRENGLIKINPLLNWSRKQLWSYIHEFNLPIHPLYTKGYLSVGCAPCTRAVKPGEGERAGRWADNEKEECGLHTVLLKN